MAEEIFAQNLGLCKKGDINPSVISEKTHLACQDTQKAFSGQGKGEVTWYLAVTADHR